MLSLYGYYRSSAAFRVRIALALKGLAYENVPVNLKLDANEQKSDAYRRLNPQGRVPLLIDGDKRITQSPAILEYLEETWPAPALLPQAPDDRAFVRQLSALIACDIHPLNNLSVLTYLRQNMGQDDVAVNRWYARWIEEGFSAVEAMLQTHSKSTAFDTGFSFGASPSMADVYLIPQVWNARRFNVNLDAFPAILAIDAHCRGLQAFIDAAPENQADNPEATKAS